ncbi:hypothetical protein AeMF1_017886 [Aphanomyces euteiches]|nr:hypothetical protein AeMF1_017886 [Aphanomyces euteiches]KAH9185920.1 hypothetical protein AeNC1_012105 [Aphanomyces euteiches]
MSESHENLNATALSGETIEDMYDASFLDDIEGINDAYMVEDLENLNEDTALEGNQDENEDTTTQATANVSIAAQRQRLSRDTKKQLNRSFYERIEDLERHLKFVKAKYEREKQIDEYRAVILAAQAHIHKTMRINSNLKKKITGRRQLRSFLEDWAASKIPQRNRRSPMETILLPDDKGRRNGCIYMTNRALTLSREKYPRRKTVEEEVDDTIHVKLHLGEDAQGTCIDAFECQLQFTIDANFENVAKTWWFDLIESTPILRSTVVEKFGDNIMYVKQEHERLKYKRLLVAGVFLDDENDRITITQTGISLDERFPFREGETRSNGIQWIVFQHVTDRLTIVRWSILSYCPVSAHGPLSLYRMAEEMRCDVRVNDTEETLLAKIQSTIERAVMGLKHQFITRCSRFKLEPSTMGSRDLPIESLSDFNVNLSA